MQIDQATYDLVVRMVHQNCLNGPKFFQVLGVNSVDITSGHLVLDEKMIDVLPTKVEENIFSYSNCDPTDYLWEDTEECSTQRSSTIELSNSVTTSTESKVGLDLGASFAKFNGDLVEKNSVTVGGKTTETVTDSVKKVIPIKYMIPGKSVLVVKVLIEKGLLRGKVSGSVVLDAEVVVKWALGTQTLRLTNFQSFRQEPHYRTVPLDGYIYSESYSKYSVVKSTKAIPGGDPICNFDSSIFQVGSHHFVKRVAPSILRFSGPPPLNRPSIKYRYGKTISFQIRQDDTSDLFVWVWDLNTPDSALVLTGARFNAGAGPISLDVLADGDDKGRISWKAVRADDDSKNGGQENVEVSAGSSIDVGT